MTQLEIYYPTGRDVNAWEKAHAAGDVPDRWPYGLHKLAQSPQLEVKSVEAKALRPFGLAKTIAARKAPEGDLRPKSIAWDEDLALRLIVERPSHQKFAGVIWATDRIAAKETGPKDLLLKTLLPRMNGLWALSQPQTNLIREWLGKDAPPVHFLRFGIDHHFFTPQRIPRAPNGTKHWQSTETETQRPCSQLQKRFEGCDRTPSSSFRRAVQSSLQLASRS